MGNFVERSLGFDRLEKKWWICHDLQNQDKLDLKSQFEFFNAMTNSVVRMIGIAVVASSMALLLL